ncbi:hypothetical protein GIB67_041576 [Kingdonia uniflora]|uniref:acetate--CoA ligase n=1 Tax=Kingdonia uniflora TaxID=39325 RepID=A0A7J7MQA5_9MAGN|nr:hypothetical protein GIB67_041576 [Kingdonia uniflora]
MIYTATTFKYAFNYKPSDIYRCTADCSWITGHSYVTYGPLLNGYTIVLCEGIPNYPDTSWKIEIGGLRNTPLPVDEKGNEIVGENSGYLCIKNLWPGAFHTLYGGHERYETTYFKPFPAGRVDDVINASGHRIGTAEVESTLVSHPQYAEAVVVGVEHEVKGQGIYAIVTLVGGMLPPSQSMSSSSNPMKQLPIPSPIHVGGSHEHFDTSEKDIIMKNPQSKYLDVGHDPLAQIFGPVKKGFENLKDMVASLRSSGCGTIPTINVERSRMATALLREEAVAHFLNFHEHIVATRRAVLPIFLKAYNGLMALPILGSVTTFEVMVWPTLHHLVI